MILHAPQLILLTLLLLSSGMYLAKHGQPKTGKYSIWGSLVSDAVVIALLYWGGFFG